MYIRSMHDHYRPNASMCSVAVILLALMHTMHCKTMLRFGPYISTIDQDLATSYWAIDTSYWARVLINDRRIWWVWSMSL